MKGVLFPEGRYPDIAIEINPFIVPIVAIDVIISKEAGAEGGERS